MHRHRLKQLRAEAAGLESVGKTAVGIESFVDDSIVWLDELRDLSLRLPPPGDAYVLDLAASPNRQGGATIRIRGRVRDPAFVAELDRNLRLAGREVLSRNFAEEADATVDFPWQFESLISAKRQAYSFP